MNILVINAGSSSLKYQLIDMATEKVLAKGLAERIGIDGSNLKQKANGKSYEVHRAMKNHVDAMQAVLEALLDEESGAVKSVDQISAVGHRVVHGGEAFAASVTIDEEVLSAIEGNISLAPLHNPANLMGIEACRAAMPTVPMVAVFDTAFHQTMPDYAYIYGLPYDYYKRLRVRRYGFHGTSHRYVASEVARRMNRPIEDLKIIVCHLGNGSSVTAVKGGKSIDTSMGMTPLEGLVMGTRSGDLDPAILEYVMKNDHLTIEQMNEVLLKKSGVLGISGVSSDMRDLTAAYYEGNEGAILAFNILTYGIRKYIGSYAAAMGGVDAIAFTAGVGENDDLVRELTMKDLEYLGAKIDVEKNRGLRGNNDISTPDATVKVMIVETNEELAIARDTLEIIKK